MKKKITNLLFLLFFVSGFQGSVFAQCTNSVPVSGNNTIAANSGSICDNGGTSSYAQNSNGYTIINPTVSCNAVSLTFTVFSTESGADFLTIYDGAGLGGTILYGPVSGTPALTTVTSLTGSLTVHFSSNATVNDIGFSANISNTPLVFPSPNPVTATPSTFCNGATVQLNATTTGTSINWYTVPTGGTSLGASVSGANFAVTPSGTTTYYAEAMFPGGGPAPGSQTFNYTGSVQTFTVPTGVTAITIDARGAQGANALDRLITNANGGLGGRAQGTLTVTPGQVLNIYVGGQGNTSGTGGFNGGGNGGLSNAGSSCSGGYAGGGGGASDIRAGGTALTNRVIVAGGGGGAGRDYCNGTCQPCGCGGSGGAGGGLTGVNGVAAGNCGFSYPGSGINGGFGGTSTAGGAGAPGDGGGVSGSAGASGIGGAGATGDYDVSGGGGGGGYFGGGGGGGASSGSGVAAGGGGGGSSYITGLTGGSTTQGYQTGNGQIIISWSGSSGCPSARTPVTVTLDATVPSPATLVTATPSTISCSGATVNLSAISSGNTIQWYTVPTGGASIGTSLSGANFAVSPTGTTTYYAQVLSSCNGLVSASRVPVTVTLTLPPSPNPVTATPSTFCNGATVQLNATTTGTSINWYTVPTGGTSLGASVSGANFAVTPSGTTTYYAEAMFPGGGPAPGSQTFNYTGSVQTFTVPTGVTAITIDARGAQGANALDRLITNANGGLGGRAQGTLTVTPGQVLNIYVGGQGNTSGTGGFNGGGNGGLSNAGSSCSGGYAGGGGGASDIRAGGTALTNRVIVAGGGGGAGRDYCNGTCQPCGCGGSGGAGGGLTGVNGVAAGNCGFSYPGSGINGGFGGTATAGGAGAPGDGGGVSGSAGASGIGGAGATGDYDVSGGGGGGGYFGGGGGGGASSGSGVAAGGGGGGSSYITGLTGGSTTQGYQTGNGQIIISWSGSSGCPSARTPVTVTLDATAPSPATLVTATPSTISCSGTAVNLSAISSGNTIQWYTVPTGGASIGSSLSGANFSVSPTGTTTYYAEVLSSCNGLVSVSRVPVTVTLSLPAPTPVTVTPSVACPGATVQLNATTTGASINWYTVPTGGTPFGVSASGANVPVVPPGTITYYAEAMFPGGGPAPGSQTFNYTGSVQTFTVPTGVTAITIDARGAQGANALDRLITNANGGLGGRAQGTLTVTPGQVLNIYVGGEGNTNGNGGFNGGGNGGLSTAGGSCSGGYAGGGGGASDIRAGGTALTNRVIVAGGGGGAGRDYCNGTCQPCGCGGSGGAGGGLTGVNGVAAGNCGFSYPGSGINGGFGGTSTAGGAGAPGDGGGVSGSAGASGIGGAGATGNYDVSGGGGGGGYFGGGGGGGAGSGSGVAAGGGGGGSSYITGLTGGSTTQGYQTGNGQIIISWSGSSGCPSPRTPVTVNIPSAPTITCPAPQTLNLNVSCGSTLGDFTTLATTTGPAPISVAQSPLPASTVTGPGATTVTLTATDACNRTATCSFTVNKVDNTAPVSPSIAAATGQCSLTLSPPTTTDNCAGAITGTTTSPLTYNSQGTYSVVWTFNDGNGNSTTATQSVIVDDVTAPVTPTLAAANIQCGGTITPPTTTDNCAGTVTGTTTAPLTYNSQGTYSVIWTFDDGNGNTSTATQSVIVNDVTAPVPNTGTLPTLNLPCGGTLTPPTATDNCAGTITGTTATLTYNLPGTYSVTWTYNDGNGNTSNQTQTVIVSGGTLSLGANSPLCTGANLNLTASGPGSGTYSWTGPNGFNSNLQNPVIPAAPLTASGTYFITASTGPGCNITSSINVHVGPLTLAVTPDPVDSTLAHTLISNCASPYTLYWRRIITGSTWSSLSSVGNTPDITGLLPATAYVAYAVDANGATTTLVYFITAGNPSCGVAPTLTAFVNCNKIFADWSTGALYSQYAISFRQVAPVLGPTASSYTTLTDKVYTVIPANFGSTYEVFVAGYCDNQFSVASAPAYVTVTDPRPVAPTGLTFSATCSSITTNWSSVPGAVGYFVKIKNPVSNSILVNYYTNATTYTRFGLIANFTYEIWVTPLGCGNLLGDESQHFLVQSCTGNAIGIRYQNPTDNPDEVAYGTDGVNENHIAIYPNPNHGVFTVSASVVTEKQALIEVVNMMGQVVYSISTLPENGRINQEISLGDEIAIGTYLIRVSTENQSFLGKFVKSN